MIVANDSGPAAVSKGPSLRDLAKRLCPNPALSVEGTLQIILDGIDRLDDEALARALGYVCARNEGLDTTGDGLDVQPLTDEQWANADPEAKMQLILSAKALKQALRAMI